MEYDKHLSSDGLFFTARTDSPATLSEAGLAVLFESMLAQIFRGAGEPIKPAALSLEVGCDTGRIILAIADSARSAKVGCSVRLQSLQDVWYDLDENGVSADTFSQSVTDTVREIGYVFHSSIKRQNAAFPQLATASIDLRVYGTGSRVPVISERIENENEA